MTYFIRNLHFIVIHIPIAMLIFSFVFDLLALFLKKKEWHAAGLLSLVVGTLGAVAAVITGPEGERNPLFPAHELYGKITMIFFILLTSVRLWLHFRKRQQVGKSKTYLAAALVGALLVSYTGHLGGQMVHPDRSKFQNRQFREDGSRRLQRDGQPSFQQNNSTLNEQRNQKAVSGRLPQSN
ncbi:DUF2231 domain-containing protein [Ferviditalea candida]|uniref:DUF2231 domain-containing protein n=1 Tax=Ferviditalea candida TaxID=3108399 RepID=A0ABU5ZFI1_9BACL|nr:DUF2231 domain-containing protein [Paenibacillaceae bacterium T2]